MIYKSIDELVSQGSGKYDFILIDPPWFYYGSTHSNQATNHYQTMSLDQLKQIPIKALFKIGGNPVVFMWATSPLLDDAIELGKAWGLHYRGVPYVWVKTSKGNPSQPIGATGVRPTFVKPITEMVLAFTGTPRGRPLPLLEENQEQLVFAPRGKHSEKPLEIANRITRLFGLHIRYLEMFSRRQLPGWDAMGNELP